MLNFLPQVFIFAVFFNNNSIFRRREKGSLPNKQGRLLCQWSSSRWISWLDNRYPVRISESPSLFEFFLLFCKRCACECTSLHVEQGNVLPQLNAIVASVCLAKAEKSWRKSSAMCQWQASAGSLIHPPHVLQAVFQWSWKNIQVHSWLRQSALHAHPTPYLCLPSNNLYYDSLVALQKRQATAYMGSAYRDYKLSRVINKKYIVVWGERLNESYFLLRQLY